MLKQENENTNPSYNIKKLSDSELLGRTQELVAKERKLSTEILHHLMEVERRRLYALRGFSSLFDYCVKSLGYSESAAQRRISSMRLLREIPEVKEKIESGVLSLSVLSQAQSFFRNEAKVQEKPLAVDAKKEVLLKLEHKSTREAERELLLRSTNPQLVYREEKLRPITPTHTEIKFVADEAMLGDIEKLKALLSHAHPSMSLTKLMRMLLDLGLKKYDPQRQVSRKSTAKLEKKVNVESASLPAPAVTLPAPLAQLAVSATKMNLLSTHVKRTNIPAQTKRVVWQRDKGKCTFQDPLTKRCCESQKFLQIDHIQPVALGGGNEIENLRLLCFEHNQLHARQLFTAKKMETHRAIKYNDS